MAKYKRMFSTQFVNAGQFKLKITNQGKLLYFYIMSNADDKGFCDNVDEITVVLNSMEQSGLLEKSYDIALKELLDKGYLYSFSDKYDNHVYLVRHWFLHNQIPKDRTTDSNYEKYLTKVFMDEDNVYTLYDKCQASAIQVPSKCQADVLQNVNKCHTSAKQMCTQIKLNKSKVNKSKDIMNEMNNIACTHTQEENNSLVDNSDEELVIPDKWDNETELVALNLLVKQKNGATLTKQENDYLLAYKLKGKNKNE